MSLPNRARGSFFMMKWLERRSDGAELNSARSSGPPSQQSLLDVAEDVSDAGANAQAPYTLRPRPRPERVVGERSRVPRNTSLPQDPKDQHRDMQSTPRDERDDNQLSQHIQRAKTDYDHSVSIHEREVITLRQSLARLSEEYNILKDSTFAALGAAQRSPPPAADRERDLTGLFDSLKQWLNKFTNRALTVVQTASWLPDIADMLLAEGCVADVGSILTMIGQNPSFWESPRSISVLLHPAIVSNICSALLGDPFFIFTGQENEPEQGLGLRYEHGQSVKALCEMLTAEGNESGAHAWRSQLLHLIDPVRDVHTPHNKQLKSRAKSCRAAAAKHVARGCFDKVKAYIVAAEHESALLQLEEYCIDAADIAWDLWQQKSCTQVLTYRELVRLHQNNEHLHYSHTSKFMDATSLHSAQLEDDKDYLNGRKVWLVCQPAIVVYDGSANDDVLNGAVLRRAIVWMDTHAAS